MQDEGVGRMEFVFKIALFLGIDEITSSLIPLTFYGTKDLPVFADFIVKRCTIGLWMGTMVLSPFDSWI